MRLWCTAPASTCDEVRCGSAIAAGACRRLNRGGGGYYFRSRRTDTRIIPTGEAEHIHDSNIKAEGCGSGEAHSGKATTLPSQQPL